MFRLDCQSFHASSLASDITFILFRFCCLAGEFNLINYVMVFVYIVYCLLFVKRHFSTDISCWE